MYLDANNLYRWIMSQSLPTSGFKWKDPNELQLNNYTKDSEKGLIRSRFRISKGII